MSLAGLLPATAPASPGFIALGIVCVVGGCALLGLVLAGIACLLLRRQPLWIRRASAVLSVTACVATGVLMTVIALAGGHW